jgi:hypothetical protein
MKADEMGNFRFGCSRAVGGVSKEDDSTRKTKVERPALTSSAAVLFWVIMLYVCLRLLREKKPAGEWEINTNCKYVLCITYCVSRVAQDTLVAIVIERPMLEISDLIWVACGSAVAGLDPSPRGYRRVMS